MLYTVLYNAPPCWSSKTESTFIEAESIDECAERFSEDHSHYHYAIFLNGKNLREGTSPQSLKDRIQWENAQEYQLQLKKEQQERLHRVRDILKQHEIELEIRAEYDYSDFDGFNFGFTYQGELIMCETIKEFRMD